MQAFEIVEVNLFSNCCNFTALKSVCPPSCVGSSSSDDELVEFIISSSIFSTEPSSSSSVEYPSGVRQIPALTKPFTINCGLSDMYWAVFSSQVVPISFISGRLKSIGCKAIFSMDTFFCASICSFNWVEHHRVNWSFKKLLLACLLLVGAGQWCLVVAEDTHKDLACPIQLKPFQ